MRAAATHIPRLWALDLARKVINVNENQGFHLSREIESQTTALIWRLLNLQDDKPGLLLNIPVRVDQRNPGFLSGHVKYVLRNLTFHSFTQQLHKILTGFGAQLSRVPLIISARRYYLRQWPRRRILPSFPAPAHIPPPSPAPAPGAHPPVPRHFSDWHTVHAPPTLLTGARCRCRPTNQPQRHPGGSSAPPPSLSQ